jgi:hypothetical protein
MSKSKLIKMGKMHGTIAIDEVSEAKVEALASEAWWNVAFFEAEDQGLLGDFDDEDAETIFMRSFTEAYKKKKGWL